MNKNIELRKIRDFGEIINDTFIFLAQNWKALLKTYAIICGFFIVASLIMSIFNQIKMVSAINDATDFNSGNSFASTSPFRNIFGLNYLLAMLFAIVSYTSINLTTFAFIALYVEKGNTSPDVTEVWGYFKFYFLRVFGSSLLLSFMIVIGFAFCLVPGFYLWPAFSLMIPVIVFENTSFSYAFSRGFQLIKDNYWTTFGVLIVSVIIVYVMMMVLIMPISIVTTGSMLVTGHKLNSSYVILNSIASHICQVFFVIPIVTVSMCYFSLTEQKDGTGLLNRINNLGNTEQEPGISSEEY